MDADGSHAFVATSRPVAFLLVTLLTTVGAPFFVVSATAPLLQRWFSRVDHPSGEDPYFLYAASNVGAMLALAAYPLLIEPHMTLGEQASAWRWGYVALAAGLAACGIAVLRSPRTEQPYEVVVALPETDRAEAALPVSLQRRLRWIFLAFVPSSLLLGVTTYITTGIAAIPLFWVVPLALYLVTFILVFARKPPVPHAWMVRLLPLGVTMTALVILVEASTPMSVITPLHLATFFVAAMVCHGELARDRPPVRFLTEFYLWISLGGVLGGLFNGVLAPSMFRGLDEYPIALVLACFCRRVPDEPEDARSRRRDFVVPLALGGFAAAIALAVQSVAIARAGLVARLILALPLFLNYRSLTRPRRFALGVGACMLGTAFYGGVLGTTVHEERNFFGVLRVTRDATGRFLQIVHGTTVHGSQSLDPERRRQPLVYYTRSGPLGQVFDAFRGLDFTDSRSRQVGVIGLGAGTMAPYARPGEEWTYYEIDPAVVAIARDPRYFTYLADAFPDPSHLKIVVGDARLRLREATDGLYDMLIVDAFSSDSIPAHLMTREAFALYRAKLAPGGLLVAHISNRYLDLELAFGNLARDSGLVARVRRDKEVPEQLIDLGKSPSQWAAFAASEAELGSLARDERWVPMRVSRGRVWTDDFSDLVSVLEL
jgi:hypothetical protein